MIVGHPLERIVNGPAHHTLHHMYFVYNYGQYFTWADRVGGSYRHPKTEDDPLNAILAMEDAKLKYKQEKEEMSLLDEKEKLNNKSTTSISNISSANPSISLQTRRNSDIDEIESITSSTSSSGRTSPSYSRSDSGFEDTNSDKESNKELPSLRRRK